MNEDCFSKIPNYKSNVAGHSFGIECYVHENFMQNHFKDTNISRCGQCLELFGPSLKPFICMIAGSYWSNMSVLSQKSIERSIVVNSESFDYLVTQNLDASRVASQISIRQVECPFSTFTRIATVEETFSEVVFQPFNSNLPIKYLQINNNIHKYSKDNYFHIPKVFINSSFEMKLVSNDKYVVNIQMNNVRKGKIFTSNTMFPKKYPTSKCSYVPNKNIMSVDRYDDVYFVWSVYLNKSTNLILLNKTIDGMVKITTEEQPTTIVGIKYPTAFKINYHFRMLVINVITPFENVVLESIKTKSIDYSFKEIILIQQECGENLIKENVKLANGTYHKTYLISLNKRCGHYSNYLSLSFKTEKGNYFFIGNSSFISRDEINFLECDVHSYDCDFAECDGSNSSIESSISHPWKTGCHPKCGECRNGYVCTKGSVCIETPNLNKRASNTKCTKVVIILIIIVFVI